MALSIIEIKEQLPGFAKDIKLNISTLFSTINSSGLTGPQFYGIGLAVAFSLKDPGLIAAMMAEIKAQDLGALVEGAQIAATIMAMNNVYYRAIHLAEDPELGAMPANLRMNAMLNPGIPKIDFELSALAVSAVNGCGLCIQSHVKQLTQHKVSKLAIQSALRLAASLQGLCMAWGLKDIAA